jgi:hypothetical protein
MKWFLAVKFPFACALFLSGKGTKDTTKTNAIRVIL